MIEDNPLMVSLREALLGGSNGPNGIGGLFSWDALMCFQSFEKVILNVERELWRLNFFFSIVSGSGEGLEVGLG
jgi:hypothetical protein